MTNEQKEQGIVEELKELLQQQNTILLQILEAIEQGNSRKGNQVSSGVGTLNNLTQQQKDDLDYEIDLDWWFANYSDEPLPAKYMCASFGVPAANSNPYTKDEGKYMYSRLHDYVDETNEQGTHVFRYLGKVWCKREKNARNCFGFVEVKA